MDTGEIDIELDQTDASISKNDVKYKQGSTDAYVTNLNYEVADGNDDEETLEEMMLNIQFKKSWKYRMTLKTTF